MRFACAILSGQQAVPWVKPYPCYPRALHKLPPHATQITVDIWSTSAASIGSLILNAVNQYFSLSKTSDDIMSALTDDLIAPISHSHSRNHAHGPTNVTL